MQLSHLRDEHGRKYLNRLERQAFYARAIHLPPEPASFCLVLLFTGCRISEALQLRPEQVDRAESVVVFETLKQRKPGVFRVVPVPKELIQLIPKVRENSRIWSYSRTTAFRLVKSVMNDIGAQGPQACPKGLRHGFGVACVERETPLEKIRQWMGHAKIETTGIYLNVVGQEEYRLASRLWSDFDLDRLASHVTIPSETE